jgi:hypothetical protein
MTIDDRIKMLLGELQLQLVIAVSNLEAANRKIAELEAAVAPVPTPPAAAEVAA